MEKCDSLNKRNRQLYIFEAAFEYLISILVSGSYLATLTRELGFSDSLTGILSSVISLGCLFQLISVALRRTRVKRIVIILSIINQLLFMLLYVIPLTRLSNQIKIVLFVIIIFVAYVIYNFAYPKKINWLMSLVDDRHRGDFTADKEIVSLIAGMVFSFLMGAVTDYFADMGKIKTAFIISAAVIFILMILHSVSMVLTIEKEIPEAASRSLRKDLAEVLKNKRVLQVTAVFVIYYISNYASTPFYGVYQINELGFNLKFVSALSICSSIVRFLFSKFWGKYADKSSFASMIEKCFILLAVSNICVIFAVPANGQIMFTLYYIFHGIAMGGINSALINMVFDYAPYKNRADSLAICQAASGTFGFLTTLCISTLVSYIQSKGNVFLGISMYAQQAITVISLVFTVVAIVYVRSVFINKQNKN